MERRQLMKALFGLGALVLPARTVARPSVFQQPSNLQDGHRKTALVRLGKACLDAHPRLAGFDLPRPLHTEESHLSARIAEDFRENRMLLVDGWLLAESEAAFYAHAYRAHAA
jgi:hypothetical protein